MRSVVYGNIVDGAEGEGDEDEDGDDLVGGMFALKKKTVSKKDSTWLFHKEDCCLGEYVEFREDGLVEMIQSIKDCFTKKISKASIDTGNDDDDEDMFGDFVDLENMDGDVNMDDGDEPSDDDYNDADVDADEDGAEDEE